jgi:hypothetical protein
MEKSDRQALPLNLGRSRYILLPFFLPRPRRVVATTLLNMDDPSAVADLLAQIVTRFESFMGDGAYDGEPDSQAVLHHQRNAQVAIPPRDTAVLSVDSETQRDHAIETNARQGRLASHCITGYNRRYDAEFATQRSTSIFSETP